MSTLTKILIVLLTISSIFLCGILVTYVSNAEDFKASNAKLTKQIRAARETAKKANEEKEESFAKFKRAEDRLNKRLSALKREVSEAKNNLKNLKRENADLVAEITGMGSSVETSSQTAQSQTKLFEQAQEKVEQLQANQIKQQKRIDETELYLQEKLVYLETLEADKKRLVEENSDLHNSLNKLLRAKGKVTKRPKPVTRSLFKAQPTPEITRKISLKALITVVDLKNQMASISIGKADGVREGMKFYVTRGDEFISEILIIEVNADEAVGILERMVQQPKIGDNASTNLL